ncbi:MAG: methionyl-tRNA formyltransferase [Woeseiaceae bacterium]
MKVLFITQDDPIYVKEFFDELLKADRDDITFAGIVLAPPMGKQTMKDLILQMWNFYGPSDFVRMGIRYVVTRVKARLPKMLRFGRDYTIGQLAESRGVPVRYVSSLNDPAFVESVRSQEISVVVSVAAPQIIKTPLIQAPRLACINIHNGTLPRYRGMLPNFWQMYDGNRTVGTTVHRINEGIDDGAILLQEESELLPDDSLDAVIRRTKRKGAAAVLKVLRQLRDGTATEKPNKREDSSYFSFPTRADVVEFRRRGYRLL